MAQPRAVTAAVIGAGHRGRFAYGGQALAHPERLRIVAVAEPDAARRDAMAREHGLGAGALFGDWRELLARPQLADAAVDRHRAIRCTWPRRSRPWPAATTCCSRSRSRRTPPTASGWSGRPSAPAASSRSATCCATRPSTAACTRSSRAAGWGGSGRSRSRSTSAPGTWRTPSCAAAFATARSRRRSCSRRAVTTSICWSGWRRPARARVASLRPPLGLHRGACAAGSARALHAGLPRAGDLRPRRGALLPRPGRCARGLLAVERRVPRSLARERAAARSRRGPTGAASTAATTTRSITSWSRSSSRTASRRRSACTATPRTRAACCASPASRASCAACSSAGSSSSSGRARSRASASGSPARRSGHFGGDAGLVAHFVDAVRRNASQEARASGREALEGHLLGFAAERAREQGRVVDFAAYRREIAAAANA